MRRRTNRNSSGCDVCPSNSGIYCHGYQNGFKMGFDMPSDHWQCVHRGFRRAVDQIINSSPGRFTDSGFWGSATNYTDSWTQMKADMDMMKRLMAIQFCEEEESNYMRFKMRQKKDAIDKLVITPPPGRASRLRASTRRRRQVQSLMSDNKPKAETKGGVVRKGQRRRGNRRKIRSKTDNSNSQPSQSVLKELFGQKDSEDLGGGQRMEPEELEAGTSQGQRGRDMPSLLL